jgi:hypothetical protein
MKKKYVFTLSILLLLTISTFSQKKIRVGVNTGLNYSSIWEKEIGEEFNSEFSFILGVNLEYSLNENLLIKSGIDFERKVVSFELPISSNSRKRISDGYDYLIIPIFLKYEFGQSKKYYLNSGPYFGYLKNRTIEKIDFLNKQNKRFNMALSLGIGHNFFIGEMNVISFEIRNNLGLSNIHDNISRRTKKINSINLIINWSLKI